MALIVSPTSRLLRTPTITIRVDWLMRAARIPGKALALALALLSLAHVHRTPTVRLTRQMITRFSISRDASYDALHRLEAERLVSVRRTPGHNPKVTLLGLDGQPLAIT